MANEYFDGLEFRTLCGKIYSSSLYDSVKAAIEALDGTKAELWATSSETITSIASGTYSGITLRVLPGVAVTFDGPSSLAFNLDIDDGGQVPVDTDFEITGVLRTKGNTSGVTPVVAVDGDETITVNYEKHGAWDVYGSSLTVVRNGFTDSYEEPSKTKTVNSATTLSKRDHGKTILVDYGSTGFDITLPPHLDGLRFSFVVIDATNSGDINDNGGTSQHTMDSLNQTVTLISDGSQWLKAQRASDQDLASNDDVNFNSVSLPNGFDLTDRTWILAADASSSSLSTISSTGEYTHAFSNSIHDNLGEIDTSNNKLDFNNPGLYLISVTVKIENGTSGDWAKLYFHDLATGTDIYQSYATKELQDSNEHYLQSTVLTDRTKISITVYNPGSNSFDIDDYYYRVAATRIF